MNVNVTKAELEAAAEMLLGGKVEDVPLDTLWRLITISQFVTDTILNEIEARGELTFMGGDPNQPIVPYQSEHSVPTILTRGP